MGQFYSSPLHLSFCRPFLDTHTLRSSLLSAPSERSSVTIFLPQMNTSHLGTCKDGVEGRAASVQGGSLESCGALRAVANRRFISTPLAPYPARSHLYHLCPTRVGQVLSLTCVLAGFHFAVGLVLHGPLILSHLLHTQACGGSRGQHGRTIRLINKRICV